MSVKQALEENFSKRLGTLLSGTEYSVVVSKELTEERPSPVVVCIAGDAQNPFDNLPQGYGNYQCDLNILVLTSKNRENASSEHYKCVTLIEQAMTDRTMRKQSLVSGLHLYEIQKDTVGEGDEGEKLGTAISYKALVNYQPLPPQPIQP